MEKKPLLQNFAKQKNRYYSILRSTHYLDKDINGHKTDWRSYNIKLEFDILIIILLCLLLVQLLVLEIIYIIYLHGCKKILCLFFLLLVRQVMIDRTDIQRADLHSHVLKKSETQSGCMVYVVFILYIAKVNNFYTNFIQNMIKQ